MTSVIPVRFACAARDLWFAQNGTDAQEGDHVICSTERGTEIGLATASAREVSASELQRTIGNSTLKPVLRVATDADLDRADELARWGDEAFPIFRRLVEKSELDMKPVRVEYLFGGEKVVCYFAAEERVDFRQLVRDLSHELHQRVDMRQIGVREEAAMVGGFGHCGQELCCSRFGLSFEPVSIRMAKEQDLPLTSNKISGACGRLMCCLRYEFEAYRDFKGRAPKRNAVIDTPLGKAKVVEYDTPKEQLALRIESGKLIRIPLGEMVASEAATKKSEELHCPCRPDTVVRASLEKLSSPDVQMALAELDRKMGVVPEEAFDTADLFVEVQPRKRRSRQKGAAKQQVAEQKISLQQSSKVAAEQPGTSEKRTRRRRRKRAAAGDQPSALAHVATQGEVTEAPASVPVADAPKEARRRRRHRTAGSDAQKPQAQASKQEDKPTRQRRRPGDRGGQKTQQPQQQKPPQHQKAPQQQQQQPKKSQLPASEADSASKRRRRRRRRGGNAGNAEGGGAKSE